MADAEILFPRCPLCGSAVLVETVLGCDDDEGDSPWSITLKCNGEGCDYKYEESGWNG